MDNWSEERTWELIAIVFLLLLFALQHSALAADEEDAKDTDGAKTLSGMSIVGNTEAPKSLFIVPWKSSEIGFETSLNAGMDDSMGPVDKEVFMRELDFYEIRHEK